MSSNFPLHSVCGFHMYVYIHLGWGAGRRSGVKKRRKSSSSISLTQPFTDYIESTLYQALKKEKKSQWAKNKAPVTSSLKFPSRSEAGGTQVRTGHFLHGGMVNEDDNIRPWPY